MPRPVTNEDVKSVNVSVPTAVWVHAKKMALDSGVPLKDYVTALLKDCRPLGRQAEQPSESQRSR